MRQFDAWSDDVAWRRAFLECERQVLTDPEEHFDNRAFIELAPVGRKVLLWLAKNQPKGATEKDIAAGIDMKGDRKVSNALNMLQIHLQLVDCQKQFLLADDLRWKITDNNTLFQINLFRDLINRPKGQKQDEMRNLNMEKSLDVLEGQALEQFGAACFGQMPDIHWSTSGVSRRRQQRPKSRGPKG